MIGCIPSCQVQAIEIREKAFITEKCVGCSRCIAVCPENAIDLDWTQSSNSTQKKMVEYSYGLVKALKSNIIYINVLNNISPACDCYGGNDIPISEDIGFLASNDPVALDKASYDLVCKKTGSEPFKKEYPHLDTTLQIDYAQEIKLGNSEYTLIDIE